ncbi:MAG: hypothetical protein QXE81_05885 [Desulfurococcaceae archaeon]
MKAVENEVYVSIYFRRTVEPGRTRKIMTVDVNFDNFTLVVFASSGMMIRLKCFETPLRRILL